MIETRKEVRGEDESWNTSSLEGVLEFFEKVGMLRSTKALRDKDILGSTLIWYLARYLLFARKEIQRLRDEVWKDDIYTDIEDLYEEFVDQEVRENGVKRSAWEERCRETEEAFWDGERQG
jgi:hypothetical protein